MVKSYSDWADLIFRAEDRMEDRLGEWETYLAAYRQDIAQEAQIRAGVQVHVNYHFALAKNILATIYFRNPDVLVSPRFTSGYEVMGPQGMQVITQKFQWAKVRQKLLQYQLEVLKFEDEAKRVIFDALFAGYGVIKLGYKPVLDSINDKSTGDEFFGGMDIDALLAELTGEGQPNKADPAAGYEPNQRITDQNPFAIRVSPAHFLMDPTATHIDEARWVVHKIIRPMDEVKDDKRYKKSVVDGMKSTNRIQDRPYINEAGRSFRSASSDYEHDAAVCIYEIWDYQNQKYLVTDAWNMEHGGSKSDFLVDTAWPYPGLRGFPFKMLTLNFDPDDPFGISEVANWDNPVNALNLVHTMRFNHIKRFNRKYEVRKGTLDPEEMSKLTSARDGTVVVSTAQGQGPSIIPIPDAPMSGDVYNFLMDMRREVDMLSGVTEQRKGQDVSDKTATEASFMEAQASKRDSSKASDVTAFVQSVVQGLDQLNVSFLDRNYAAFVTDPMTAMVWHQQPSEILRMEAEVKVRVSSSMYKSREVQVQQLLKYLNLTAQLVDPMTGLPVVNVRAIIKDIGEMIDLEAPERYIFPMALPPMQGPGGPLGGPGGQPPGQRESLRNGPPTMGNMLSQVQNGSGQPTAPPNPQNER